MSYKDTRAGLLNTEKRTYSGVGPYGIPEIFPATVDITGLEVIGFNYMLGEKHPEDKVLHFFLDDYQFERVWKEPDKYIPYLRKFRYVIAPDFSLYVNHPKAVQIFNHYRKHWCARYWQDHGVNVIPCICWSDESSFEWCFDGTPKHAPICISTIGGFGNHVDNREAWLSGYKECVRVLEPSQILIFGEVYEELQCGVPMMQVRNKNIDKRHAEHKKKTVSMKMDLQLFGGRGAGSQSSDAKNSPLTGPSQGEVVKANEGWYSDLYDNGGGYYGKDVQALMKYQNSSQAVNEQLREGELKPSTKTQVNKLTKILDGGEVKEGFIAHRSSDGQLLGIKGDVTLENVRSKIGQTVTDKGFMSTALSDASAAGYSEGSKQYIAKTGGIKSNSQVRYHIDTPAGKGVGGLVLGADWGTKGNRQWANAPEFIFSRSSQFVVTGAYKKDGVIHCNLQYVGNARNK